MSFWNESFSLIWAQKMKCYLFLPFLITANTCYECLHQWHWSRQNDVDSMCMVYTVEPFATEGPLFRVLNDCIHFIQHIYNWNFFCVQFDFVCFIWRLIQWNVEKKFNQKITRSDFPFWIFTLRSVSLHLVHNIFAVKYSK